MSIQALTKEQAVAAVQGAVSERDVIQANLLELDGSFGKRLLAGAALTGQTKTRWDKAARTLAILWDLYSAYSGVVDRAAEAVAGRLGPRELVQVTELLAGPSVQRPHKETRRILRLPAARRSELFCTFAHHSKSPTLQF